MVIGLVEVEAQFFVSFGPAFDGIDLARQELLQIARFVPQFRQTLESAFSLAYGGPGGICGYKHAAPKGALCPVALASPPGARCL